MRYVDGYVLPVPKKKLQAYLRMARMGAKIWRKHGALDYKECVGLAGHRMPLWPSVLAFVLLSALSIWMWRLARAVPPRTKS